MSTKSQVSLGSGLWLAGAALSAYIGIIDAPATNEPVVLAVLGLWIGLLAFLLSWSCHVERLMLCVNASMLAVVTALFAIELVEAAGNLSWALALSWLICITGGALFGLAVVGLRRS